MCLRGRRYPNDQRSTRPRQWPVEPWRSHPQRLPDPGSYFPRTNPVIRVWIDILDSQGTLQVFPQLAFGSPYSGQKIRILGDQIHSLRIGSRVKISKLHVQLVSLRRSRKQVVPECP